MGVGTWALDSINHTDLFTLCDGLPDASVDMVLADLPYGKTDELWDEIVPFVEMWNCVGRVLKQDGVVALTADQPFSSQLVLSNASMFRYEWIWRKTDGGGFLNANRRPLPRHEGVLIFYRQEGVYNPQFTDGTPYKNRRGVTGIQVNNGGKSNIVGWLTDNDGRRYPTSVLEFPSETGLHPTQKPVALFRYLIRTYTRAGEVVLDPTCGSGTTAVAARAEGRRFICGDTDAHYCDVARDRLRLPFEPRRVKADNDLSGLPLFAGSAPAPDAR